MDFLVSLLIDLGYWGMAIAAFIAGSFLPFSSEVVMVALNAMGLSAWKLVAFGSVGNVMGGFFNYYVGSHFSLGWIERHLHVSHEKIEQTEKFMGGRGAMMGFFTFLPIIGSVISIVLGITRANIPLSLLSMALGKTLRYVALMYGVSFIF